MMKAFNYLFLTLLAVGGLNWGLIGLFDFNLVSALFGSGTWLERIVYMLVGVSALYSLMFYKYFSRED